MTETVEKTENEKNLLTAFVAGYKNIFNFKTRASKYDYWGFIFANFLFSLILIVAGVGLSLLFPVRALMDAGVIIYFAYSIVKAIAALALSARRLHDTNHSGKHLFIFLAPILMVGLIAGFSGALSALSANGNPVSDSFKTICTAAGSALGIFIIGYIVWIAVMLMRKGNAEENRFGKPVEEDKKYDKFANLYIILYVLISIAGGVADFMSENNSKNADAVDTVSGETSVDTVDADSNADTDTQEPAAEEPAEAETEAQPENSAEVETPSVPMHESAE